MMGRNHAVSGAASFVILTGGAALLSARDWSTPVGDGVGYLAGSACAVMLDGHAPFSLWMAFCLALFMLGCLLPDADSRASMVGRYLTLPFAHRTWLHSIWPVVGFFVVGWWLFRPLCWLALGWFVHLFWDSLSRQGVCWFYPHPGFIEYDGGAKVKRGHWLWFYRAKSTAEDVVTWVSVAMAVVVLVIVFMSGLIPMGF